MNLQIELCEFDRVDNVEYSSWFSDPIMMKHMGPAWSDAELDQIFLEGTGSVLSAFHTGELVGVVSLEFPDNKCSSYGVTGVAVKPQVQRQGFGAKILTAVLSYYKTSRNQEWIGFVNISNNAAQRFMEKQGWERGGIDNEMYRYTYVQRG